MCIYFFVCIPPAGARKIFFKTCVYNNRCVYWKSFAEAITASYIFNASVCEYKCVLTFHVKIVFVFNNKCSGSRKVSEIVYIFCIYYIVIYQYHLKLHFLESIPKYV